MYQNTGLGKISNKITQLEILLSYRRPDILFIAESTIDDQTIKLLENVHGYDVEYISEEARLWAAIKKGCVYSRMKDLEVDGLPLIWLKVGTKTKYYVGGFYREWQKLGQAGSLKVREQKLRFNKFLESWEKVKKHSTWLTDELKQEIETKNKLYKKSLETKKEEDWKEYKALRNKITRQMRKAKKDQISDNLTKLNDQKMWDQAKKHLGWGRPGPPSQILENGVHHQQSKTISKKTKVGGVKCQTFGTEF